MVSGVGADGSRAVAVAAGPAIDDDDVS